MFLIFTGEFGKDFYVPAAVLLIVQVFLLFFKFTDFSCIYRRFKEEDLVNDLEIERSF